MVVGKLYLTEFSPAVRAVLLTEKALGIELEHIELNLMAGDQLKPEFVKLNPQHTVPTLVDGDGTVVWDSHAIMAYLASKYGKTDALYPKNLAQRAVVDQRMHFENGNLFSALRAVLQPLFKQNDAGPLERNMEGFKSNYEMLNTFLEGKQWMAGDHMTIADLSIIATISSICHLLPIDAAFTNLLAWKARCEALPYYSVNAAGAKKFGEFVSSLIAKAKAS